MEIQEKKKKAKKAETLREILLDIPDTAVDQGKDYESKANEPKMVHEPKMVQENPFPLPQWQEVRRSCSNNTGGQLEYPDSRPVRNGRRLGFGPAGQHPSNH